MVFFFLMPHELQLILSVPNCHWRIPPCGHFLTRNLLSTFDVPQAKPIYPPPTVTLGPFLSLCPQGQPGGGLSRQAGLRELHLTPPAQHCLLRPLWECCAICRPQTFYEQEDEEIFLYRPTGPQSGLLPPPPLHRSPW